MRFLSLQRETIQVHSSRACLPRYVPLSGFFNLLVIYSSNRLVVLFRTTCAHGIRSAECSPQMKYCILVRYNSLPHTQQVSTSESVHIPLWCYPQWAADTLMSLFTLFTSQGLRSQQSRAYRFTLCIDKSIHSLALLPYKPEHFAK